MSSIGENIRKARKEAGLTQMELAKKTSLSRSYIGDIEKDRYNPSVATLQTIAAATNVPVEQLLGANSLSAAQPALTERDEHDIQKKLQAMLDDLDPDSGLAYYNGKEPMDDETRDLIRSSLENSLRTAKQIAKAKYTPKKYRKE